MLEVNDQPPTPLNTEGNQPRDNAHIEQENAVNQHGQSKAKEVQPVEILRLSHFGFSQENHTYSFELRKHSLKITVIENQSQPQQTIQSLFQNQKQAQQKANQRQKKTFIINNKCLPKEIKEQFINFEALYNHIYDNFSDAFRVLAGGHELKLRIKKDEEIVKEIDVNWREMAERKDDGVMNINVNNMQDRILQFSNQQMQLIEQTYHYYLNHQQNQLEQNSHQNHQQNHQQANHQPIHEQPNPQPNNQQPNDEPNQENHQEHNHQVNHQQQQNHQPNHQQQQIHQPNQLHNHASKLHQFLLKVKPLVDDNDEDQFFQLYIKQVQEQFDQANELKAIEDQEKSIEDFEQKFAHLKKIIYNSPAPYHPINPQHFSQTSAPINIKQMSQEDKVSVATSRASSLFPPGYVPPHLAKQTAPDGLSTDQHLRFQANQSKKEKLKLAKQLLRMGFSTSQVIQKLQAQEKSMKSGNIDPNAMMMQSKPMTQARPSMMPFVAAQNQAAQQNSNEKAVREMLITLLREKRYKKLDQIQRHMANQGLNTTVQALKRIIDQIKAKNLQRKTQSQRETD